MFEISEEKRNNDQRRSGMGRRQYDRLKISDLPYLTPRRSGDTPWVLIVFTLGRFLVIKNGKPLKVNRKGQSKPLSMLKALIAFGGNDVQSDRIVDVLWPDDDGDVAYNSFATTLHRLRNLVGNSEMIELSNGRLSLNRGYCWVDVWEFEWTFKKADMLWKKAKYGGNMQEAIGMAEKVMDIYKGGFLESETWEPWAISLQERLRSKFLRDVNKLSRYWEEVGDNEKMIECYLRALDVDDLAEDFYIRLMGCYERMGRYADAMAVYDRCRRTFLAIQGLEPPPEMESIRKRIHKRKR